MAFTFFMGALQGFDQVIRRLLQSFYTALTQRLQNCSSFFHKVSTHLFAVFFTRLRQCSLQGFYNVLARILQGVFDDFARIVQGL